ncbi:hypothetical protein ACLEPN_32020 [Myxococcus sp. 1LA]
MSATSAKSSWVLAVLLGLSAAISVAAPPSEELVSREPGTENFLFCPAARCSDDWHCQDACPEAVSAVCVNFYCQYDEGGGNPGGGGGGGPGEVCGAMRCGGDWNCVCQDVQGTCGPNFMCVF